MPHKQSAGKRGEALAIAALSQAGYVILRRNWRCAYGELDIIAQDGPETVCIEVRARYDGLEAALQSITSRKRARLAQLAAAYQSAFQLENSPCRVDVVAVDLRTGQTEIIRNALDW